MPGVGTPRPAGRSFVRRLIAATSLALLALAAFGTGLTGGFVFDDNANIAENPWVQLERLTPEALAAAGGSGLAGPTMRPLSMVSFAVNHAIAGLAPWSYKLVNLAIHWLNALAVYALLRLLLATPALAHLLPDARHARLAAWLVAAAWLLHPINLTNVLYVVQRMNALAGLFTLLGVLVWLSGRLRLAQGRAGFWPRAAAALACGALAVLCKENGALLVLYLGVCELVLFRAAGARAPDADRFFVLFLVLPLAAGLLFLALEPGWLAARYEIRSFTPGERLLTEARVLWLYLYLLFVPDFRAYGLYHDDIVISNGLLEPWTTLPALGGLVVLLAGAWALRRRAPLVTFAAYWFLAGHTLESTIIPLEVAYEHRNYLPAIGPLAAAITSLLALGVRHDALVPARLAAGGLVLLLGLVTFIRSEQWSDPLTHALAEAQYHPHSYRANYELARVAHALYARDGDPRQYQLARAHFAQAARLDPRSPLPFIALIQHAYRGGEAPHPSLLEQARARLRGSVPHPNVVSALKALVDCQVRGECRLAVGEVIDLFGASLANPSLGADLKPYVLTQLAAYYANGLGDPGSAADLMRQVVAEFPAEPQHRLNLVRTLIAAGRLEAARAELKACAALVATVRNPLIGIARRTEVDALVAQLQARESG